MAEERRMAAMGDGQRLALRGQRRSGLHRGRRHQAVALPCDPQAGFAQRRQCAAQVGVFQQAQALQQRALGGRTALDQALAQRAQLLAGVCRAHHVQCQEAFQGAAEVGGQLTPELLEHRRFHRMWPILAAHETRGGRDHRQPAHLRQRRCRMQCEQPAQRPAAPHRRRRGRGNGVDHERQAQRRGVVAAMAMAGQIDPMQGEPVRQALHQRCEHAALQGPAMDQNQVRPTAGHFNMHGQRRGTQAKAGSGGGALSRRAPGPASAARTG
ncbi:hypothetical protein G6F35_013324 [Rhizopus arrhizus]|nr:hypothetical protein G6F35_013324 [Rhizopus arrhizus]